MAAKKSAIEVRMGHPQGIGDDIIKWTYDKLGSTFAKKGAKAFAKMEKTAEKAGGSIRRSIVPSENTPKKLVRKWDRAEKAFTKNYRKFDIYNSKARKKK